MEETQIVLRTKLIDPQRSSVEFAEQFIQLVGSGSV